MTVIMLTGKAQSGKDTFYELAKEIVDGMGDPRPRIQRFGFADSLKRIAKDFGWNGSKEGEGRAFLIDVGQILRGEYYRGRNAKRELYSVHTNEVVARKTYDLFQLHVDLYNKYTPNPNFWVDQVLEQLRQMQDQDLLDFAIITDWRFENEYHVIKDSEEFDVCTFRITRSDRVENELAKSDISEIGLDGFHTNFVYKNDGDLDRYRQDMTTFWTGMRMDMIERRYGHE